VPQRRAHVVECRLTKYLEHERIAETVKKTFRVVSLLTLILALCGGAMACKSNPPSTLGEAAVREYADPATEVTLQGFSAKDLAKYTQYGNAGFKAAVTQQVLDQAATQVGGQFGTYESKQFLSAEEQEGYVVVHYKAKYTRNEVGVRMVFDSDHLVAGHFFE
jgi:hypothetical protein